MTKKLNINQDRYCGETIDIDCVLDNCTEAAIQFGWIVEKIPVPNEKELIVFKKQFQEPLKRVYISAGIHGDEPAGPLAILELLKKNTWPENIEFHIFPCLNVSGFKNNTRENEDCVDLNRDYYHCKTSLICAHVEWLDLSPNYDLTLCLHEDWGAKGFYLYEALHQGNQSVANHILESVRSIFPIDDSSEIDGYPAVNGIIGVPTDLHALKHWPEALYLFEKKKAVNYTLETSSDFPLECRVKAMCAAVRAAIESIK
ncbi:MAG: M14 family metallocarboxypeptidase [Patescibacteria group bacterium]